MLKNKTLEELVNQDTSRGYVLFNFGIRFFEGMGNTLEQTCNQFGLKLESIEEELSYPRQFQEKDLPLKSYPIELVIEYLKHAHSIFIKHKLPYIGRLVESFHATHADYISIEKDLKILFPLFAQDFIEHIYHEEDSLFTYIQQLDDASSKKHNPSQLFYQMEKTSLQSFAIQHEAHDDEMEGIRKITKNYHLTSDVPLHVRVIYHELMEFENSLKTHAQIENEILFPKALMIENKVRRRLGELVKFN